MVSSKALTVDDYLAELPPDRRAVIAAARAMVNENLPAGIVETMNWGMIAWEIPLARYPDTYNGQPLMFAALAAQKNFHALYLSGIYVDPGGKQALQDAFAAAGKKLDMGKSCIRFKQLGDLPMAGIAKVIKRADVPRFIAHYEAGRAQAGVKKGTTKTAPAAKVRAATANVVTKKAATKKTALKTLASEKTAASKKPPAKRGRP